MKCFEHEKVAPVVTHMCLPPTPPPFKLCLSTAGSTAGSSAGAAMNTLASLGTLQGLTGSSVGLNNLNALTSSIGGENLLSNS